MKNKIIKIGAMAASAVMLATSIPAVATAAESNYSYIYDYWGDVQEMPDAYNVCDVFTSSDLGLDTMLKNPDGMYVRDNMIYICDTGNNRIVILERTGKDSIELVKTVDKIKGSSINTLSGPTDIAVSEEGNIFIADKGNSRILKLDSEFNYILEFGKPDDQALTADQAFLPNKIVIDTAERVYCIATGINRGLIKYEADATFSGFIGATKVVYNFGEYLKKKFASQEQLARMESFVPTEYDNIYMDNEGFIYTVTDATTEEDLKAEKGDAVRKLNLLGNDILVRNGEWPIYGDLYMGAGGGYSGPSQFADITVLDNDIFICLDKNRGRLFGYDDQGNMVYIFGGNGNMDGYFRMPSAIDHMGNDLIVLDSLDNSLTLFIPTEFGQLVYTAMEQFDIGEYEASGQAWEEVMKLDGNYTLAYIGIGRSLLRQKQYGEAMDYFDLKYDADNYSKAFQQYRKKWVEKNIAIIVIVILAVFLIPLGIGKINQIKREIDKEEFFNK